MESLLEPNNVMINAVSNDGCSSTCQIETLWTCTGQPSACTHNGPTVWNGRLERRKCDDRALINGDGCSNRCQKDNFKQSRY